MKIIRPGFEILTPIDGMEMLKAIEQAGRVCYKSEDRITEDSAEKFVAGIIKRGHEAVLEHQSVTVRFIVDRGVSHEIVRHRLASYCVSGDTVLRAFSSQKSWTVDTLYRWQFDKQRSSRLRVLRVRSMDGDSRAIVPNTISRIYLMGTKPVIKLTTESGRSIKLTSDHKVATEGGWVEAGTLQIGDTVLSNGRALLDNPDWISWYYISQNHTRKETAEFIGCSEATLYKAFKRFGIVKPWSDRPNRRPGHSVKGAMSVEGREKLRELHIESNNPMYKQDRASISLGRAHGEANALYRRQHMACEFCGRSDDVEIHHIDRNPRNNAVDNIRLLCPKCHNLWHKPGALGVFPDKIVSIEDCGLSDVYDIALSESPHNFVANGLVVHNCQESTRYCCYANDRFGKEITVIEPCYWERGTEEWNAWESAMKSAEAYYLRLLEIGAAPQEARAVLPNSLKTEVVMTANLREWRHFLKLRSAPAAHPQMREVAVPLLRELQRRIPVVFDGIEVAA